MVLLIIAFVSCDNSKDDNITDAQPQITCEYFSELKPDILEFSENGLNISLTIGTDIHFDNVKSYGFVYGLVGDSKRRVVEGSKPFSKTLNALIADSLICGLEYEITGELSIGNSICLSKAEYFTAQRSYPSSPWCAGVFKSETGYDRSRGVSINNKPFVIFQNNSFYGVDDQSTLSPKASFPLSGNTGVEYGIFSIGKYGYFKSTDSNDLYRYDSEGNSWENLGVTNLYLYTKYFGGQLNGIGYFFNHRRSYQYDAVNNTFIELSNYQQQEFINYFQTKSNIYVINKDFEILKFNTSSGNWEYLSTYPGNKSEDIVNFVYMNKVYIGLSHNYHYPGYITHYDIYELDLATKNWRQLNHFPYKFNNAWGISSISSESKSYIIYRDLGSNFPTFVWSFNPSEIVYK